MAHQGLPRRGRAVLLPVLSLNYYSTSTYWPPSKEPGGGGDGSGQHIRASTMGMLHGPLVPPLIELLLATW